MKNKLVWNVYLYDTSNKQIISVNIFELSSRFNKDIEKLKKDMKKHDKSWFNEELKKALLCSYWAKVEYEIALTEPFPSINNKELIRVNNLERNKYMYDINLNAYHKIDVYNQVNLNWDIFIEYVYNNI